MSGFRPPAASPADVAALQGAVDQRVAFYDDEADDAAQVVVDAAGREVWTAVGLDGGPRPAGARKIADATTDLIGTALGMANDTADESVALSIEDATGRMVLSFLTTGHLHPDLRTVIGQDLLGAPPVLASIVASVRTAITSTADVVLFGNSITAGVDATPATRWGVRLASTYGLTVVNRGISGDKSSDIAARQGGIGLRLNVSGGQIPASGSVGVTLRRDPNNQLADPVRFTNSQALLELTLFDDTVIAGQLAGTGSSSDGTRAWTFTRNTAGNAVTVGDAIVEARVAHNDQYRGSTQIIWTPENNLGDDTTPKDVAVNRVIADTQAMVGWLTPTKANYLVISPLDRGASEGAGTTVGIAIRQIEQRFRELFGPRFVPLREFLSTSGLAFAGITPTAGDLEDMAAGAIGRSLRANGGIHPNDLAQPPITWFLHLWGKRLGFWT